MTKKQIISTLIMLLAITTIVIASECKINLVLGSDTAIWDGMSTTRYQSTYNAALYTDPSMNGNRVMSDNFRSNLVDSYGTPMKLTWWMMCGNIFRHATNTDCPIPNTMTMYHMKENYMPQVEKWGDELTLHYHTFFWSDYDNDGKWYWNQAETFEESRKDFDFTLCQLLLEEENFFVSFRSGWHYMDNDWQTYLNELMPFSMHNAYPSYKNDPTEPTNNNIDWRIASDKWIPYQPSPENYQLPGGDAGWNLRSEHIGAINWSNPLDSVFARAARGIELVVCLWGHLPEEDFCDNLEKIDSVAHEMESKYGEPFKYCTAVEGMQNWLQTQDQTAPQLILTENKNGNEIYIDISVDEPIFQKQPYVAVKDIFENYYKMDCELIGNLTWRTKYPIDAKTIAKIGVAVCDSVGNQDMDFIIYLPDDKFIDNGSDKYHELNGDFQANPVFSWGIDSRVSTMNNVDTVVVSYDLSVEKSTYYNLFYQVPVLGNKASNYQFQVVADDEIVFTKTIPEMMNGKEWYYVGTVQLDAGKANQLMVKVPTLGQTTKLAVFDVLKISPLVSEYDLDYAFEQIDFGDISIYMEEEKTVSFTNKGYKSLSIQNMYSMNGSFEVKSTSLLTIEPMSDINIELSIEPQVFGEILDTLVIESNDQQNPISKIPVLANAKTYFFVIDNEDAENYFESGTWNTSNAEAYGNSSRYGNLNETPRSNATFTKTLQFQGIYEIEYIVPKTVNAANNVLYTIRINNTPIDSIIVDQNEGSGDWIALGRYFLPTNYPVSVKVEDTGNNTLAGTHFLRADAVRFSMIEDLTGIEENTELPQTFSLEQNYPNPFNNSTVIQYAIPANGKVNLTVYNLVGQEVDVLVDENQSAGNYKIDWDASQLSTGVYFFRLIFDEKAITRKVMLMK